MPEPNVYSLLLQAFHADKSAARLLHALEELAGRLEVSAAAKTGRAHNSMRFDSGKEPELLRHPKVLLSSSIDLTSCTPVALQAAEGVDAALRFQESSRTFCDLSNLQLPDPAQGEVPSQAKHLDILNQPAAGASELKHKPIAAACSCCRSPAIAAQCLRACSPAGSSTRQQHHSHKHS